MPDLMNQTGPKNITLNICALRCKTTDGYDSLLVNDTATAKLKCVYSILY